MCEPCDEWSCKYDETPELENKRVDLDNAEAVDKLAGSSESTGKGDNDFSFRYQRSLSEDDDELTESKIKAFLDEKVVLLFLVINGSVVAFMNSCMLCGFVLN